MCGVCSCTTAKNRLLSSDLDKLSGQSGTAYLQNNCIFLTPHKIFTVITHVFLLNEAIANVSAYSFPLLPF